MAMALENIKAIRTPAVEIGYDYDGLAKVYNERDKNNGIITLGFVQLMLRKHRACLYKT